MSGRELGSKKLPESKYELIASRQRISHTTDGYWAVTITSSCWLYAIEENAMPNIIRSVSVVLLVSI